jgi:hypothetical protein
MYWDDLLRKWRRDNRSLGPRMLAGTAGMVAVTPNRRRGSRRTLVALVLAVLVLLALGIGSGRVHADVPGSAIPAPTAVSVR